MTQHINRRAVLGGLATTIGTAGLLAPAIAGPRLDPIALGLSREDLRAAYSQWLFYERRYLLAEMYGENCGFDVVPMNTRAQNFHMTMWPERWDDRPLPSTRAALVLSAVGCDLRSAATERAVLTLAGEEP